MDLLVLLVPLVRLVCKASLERLDQQVKRDPLARLDQQVKQDLLARLDQLVRLDQLAKRDLPVRLDPLAQGLCGEESGLLLMYHIHKMLILFLMQVRYISRLIVMEIL